MTTAAERWEARMNPPKGVEHFPSCTRDAHGRAVLFFIEDEMIARDNIVAYAEGLQNGTVRENGFKCPCLDLRLSSVENRLRAAKRAFEAHLTDDNAQRVTNLEFELDQLRSLR